MSDYISEELIVEIFSRLPVKCLLRYRSVSKSLRSCINSPAFILMHTSRSPQRLVFTHLVKNIKEYGVSSFYTFHAEDQLPLCPIRPYIGIPAFQLPCKGVGMVASCNGILLLLDYENGIISLWNPSIMRLLTLPDCPRRWSCEVDIGIGFDPITDDHKIVSIPRYGEGIVETPFVYGMKTRFWSPIASPMPLFSRVVSTSCYHNGLLHWAVERCFTDSTKVKLGYIIMTLDLSTHVFGMIDLPKPNWGTYHVTTIQGSLAVVSWVSSDCWIWVKRDASWSVIFKSEENQVRRLMSVLKQANNGGLLLITYSEGLHVYNPETGARSRLVDFNDTCELYDMEMYVESLQLLGMGTTCDVNHLLLQDKNRKIKHVKKFKSIRSILKYLRL